MFEAFQLGPFLFRSYHLFLLIGVWLSIELFVRIAVSQRLRLALFLNKAPYFIAGLVIGGRLFGVLLLYRVYVQDPFRIFILWDGMFNILGACIGMGLVLFLVTSKQRAAFLQWMDGLMPPIALLLAFDWLGRFFGSLSYGKPTDVPWGVIVESMSVRYTVPIHPIQLYYSAWFFGLTVILLMLTKKKVENKCGTGVVTLTGITLGCLSVLIFEFMRGDFAVTVFAKLSDFAFLFLLFMSLGGIALYERKISHRYSLVNSMIVGLGTVAYILLRPFITVATVEWRLSQFLAVLAVLAVIVYVVVHRWKYPHL